MKHSFPIIFILLLFTVSCKKSSSLIQDLHGQDKVASAYHLYPSTLRMLNFVDVESINKVVKNIEKLTFMYMDADSFDYDQLQALSNDLQKNEDFDLYMEMVDVENQLYVLGKESPAKTLFLITQEGGSQYIVDIEGRPDLMQLTRAWDEINSMDSTQTSGFTILRDMIDQDAEYRKRNRERQRKWEERKRLEKEGKLGKDGELLESKKDTILTDSVKLIN